MTDVVPSRHEDDHPTTETLPTLPVGNRWQFNEELREWEIVMTPQNPKWGEHPLPDLPNPKHTVLARSSIYNPLPKKVSKTAKTVKLESEDGSVKLSVPITSDDQRVEFGAVEWWNVVLLPRQGGPEVDRG